MAPTEAGQCTSLKILDTLETGISIVDLAEDSTEMILSKQYTIHIRWK
jgi:hypothetical protein